VAIDQALLDDRLLGAALGDPEPWLNWRSVLRAAFALRMDRQDREFFASVSGNRQPPAHRVSELWACIGRRAGKTRVAALIASFIGAIEQHNLAPGEEGFVLVIGPSKPQARLALKYAKGFLERSPVLRRLITNVTQDEIKLSNGVTIGVNASSFRSVRGFTLLAVIADEVA
jgi:phage terminase large subunit-like protein